MLAYFLSFFLFLEWNLCFRFFPVTTRMKFVELQCLALLNYWWFTARCNKSTSVCTMASANLYRQRNYEMHPLAQYICTLLIHLLVSCLVKGRDRWNGEETVANPGILIWWYTRTKCMCRKKPVTISARWTNRIGDGFEQYLVLLQNRVYCMYHRPVGHLVQPHRNTSVLCNNALVQVHWLFANCM